MPLILNPEQSKVVRPVAHASTDSSTRLLFGTLLRLMVSKGLATEDEVKAAMVEQAKEMDAGERFAVMLSGL